MKKVKRLFSLLLVLAMVMSVLPVIPIAADAAAPVFQVVESRLVTEVLDWGETITAMRIEYSDEIWAREIEYSIEHADLMTYKMVTDREIVNIYVNNSGKKDDIQNRGKYVFINFGIGNEDFSNYRDHIVFQQGSSIRPQPISYYWTQSRPIKSVNGAVCTGGNATPAQANVHTYSTARGEMKTEKDRKLPVLDAGIFADGTVAADDSTQQVNFSVREIRTASAEVRVVIDDFRTFEFTNKDTDTMLKFHLYIPEGYGAARDDGTADDLPMVVHFPNGGDMNYDDDLHIPNESDRRYFGALFGHPDATYWAAEKAQKRNKAFVMSLAGTGAGRYGGTREDAGHVGEARPEANWSGSNWYSNSQMEKDYVAAMRWVKKTFNIDTDRVSAINLAASANAMYGTLLSDDVNDFSAAITVAYDLYHSFASNADLSIPDDGQMTPDERNARTYEQRVAYAEEQYAKIMNKVATWAINGLNDRTGLIPGDPTYRAPNTEFTYDARYDGRYKGERGLDFARRMNQKAGREVVVANDWNTMWNGLINQVPSTNRNLMSDEDEIIAKQQTDRAAAVGTRHLVSVVMPNTIGQTSHWSWNPAYRNPVVQDWLYAQKRSDDANYEDVSAPAANEFPDMYIYEGMSPRTPRDIENLSAEEASLVEARLVTEVLDWGETITAVRLEYSEEILVDAVEHSVEHANRQTYQMATERDITNVYVNNSGRKDDYQTQGKYVFINLGLESEDFTSYRDQVVFQTSLRTRPRPNPYYLYQAFPIMTVSGKIIPPHNIATATTQIKGTLMDTTGLPNIEQMDVWSTEVRETIDGFRTFIYTNLNDKSNTKFHLYIPAGYEKKDESLANIPLVVHFPSGDTRYVDDVLGDPDASRQMGALFTHPDAAAWATDEAQADQKAFVLTPGDGWNANYMHIVKTLAKNLNVDLAKIGAISLAGGTTPMWETILANPNVFSAYIGTAYDPYHSFSGGRESTASWDERKAMAETAFKPILDNYPGWNFVGLTDGSGAGQTPFDDATTRKGDRWLYYVNKMNEAGANIDISYGADGEDMLNGMLRGKAAEDEAQAQLDRATANGSKTLVTVYTPGTVLQTMHWSWMSAYTNAVNRNWLFAQTNPNPVGLDNIADPQPPVIPSGGGGGTGGGGTGSGGSGQAPAPVSTPVPSATPAPETTPAPDTQTDGTDGTDGAVGTDGADSTTTAGGVTIPPEVQTSQNSDGTVSLVSDATLEIAGGVLIDVPAGTAVSAEGNVIKVPNGSESAFISLGGEIFVVEPGMTIEISDDGTPMGGMSIYWDNPFRDVTDVEWFFGDAQYAYTHGLMAGTSETLFDPNTSTTRGMIVTVLYRVAGSPDVSAVPDTFTDVADNAWYADAVKWAQAGGIVQGYGEGVFGPDDVVSREQLAAIMSRYAAYTEVELLSARDYTVFADEANIAVYAADAVKQLYSAAILNGKQDNLFDPQGQATRAEFAAMIHRFLQI